MKVTVFVEYHIERENQFFPLIVILRHKLIRNTLRYKLLYY